MWSMLSPNEIIRYEYELWVQASRSRFRRRAARLRVQHSKARTRLAAIPALIGAVLALDVVTRSAYEPWASLGQVVLASFLMVPFLAAWLSRWIG